MSSRG